MTEVFTKREQNSPYAPLASLRGLGKGYDLATPEKSLSLTLSHKWEREKTGERRLDFLVLACSA